MKICVFGAGAVGGHVAATLAFAQAANVPVPALEAVVPLIAFKASAKGLYAD